MKSVNAEAILIELSDKYNKAASHDDAMSAGECEGLWTAIKLIEAASSDMWKPASVKPEKEGKYLAVCGKISQWYTVLNYGEYEDWETEETKRGWYEINYDCDYIEFDDDIWCWMELPDMPEVEE